MRARICLDSIGLRIYKILSRFYQFCCGICRTISPRFYIFRGFYRFYGGSGGSAESCGMSGGMSAIRPRALSLALAFFISGVSVAFGASELDKLPYNEDFEGVRVELLISYKIISKDNLAIKESYRVSHAMNYKGDSLQRVGECEIDASAYAIMDDMPYFITMILKREKEQVLECLLTQEVHIRERTNGRNSALSSRTTLAIPPTRVRARLENKSIILEILSKEGV